MSKFLLSVAVVLFYFCASQVSLATDAASQNQNLQAQLQNLQRAMVNTTTSNPSEAVQANQLIQAAAANQAAINQAAAAQAQARVQAAQEAAQQTNIANVPVAPVVPIAATTTTTTAVTAPQTPRTPRPRGVATTTTTSVTGNALAAAAAADVGDDLGEEAFSKMTTTTLPMTPAQIEILHRLYDATQRSAGMWPGIPPKPTSVSLAVNLSPGATPPIVRLASGFVSSLVFVDSTGAPWPIQEISVGNPTAFNVQWDQKSNILLVQAITAYRSGNLAVILKGLNTPVMLELKPGQAAMDARADIRVPGLGPNASPFESGLPGTGSPVLLSLLDGIPPAGSKLLKSSVCDNCAWVLDGKLYLRTQFEVLSPAWITTMSSADGTHVYEMQLTPCVLVSYNGKNIKMNLEGF